jgi:hypothetical protein
MPKERKTIKWLDLYRRLRKPTAPPPKAHGTKGYTKADRRKGKKEIRDEEG